MKTKRALALSILAGTLPQLTIAQEAFYGDPPDETHPWAVHDHNRPQPPRVEPGVGQDGVPSDAIVLFSGSDLEKNWLATKDPKGPARWDVVDGKILQCKPGTGDIITKEHFGDCQLHIEWAAPKEVKGNSQGRGNSGVFFMGRTEVQVLDNFNNPTYADGFAGSVYGVNPPMANALRAPGQFNVYDIVFRRPIFKDGKEVDPGRLTVFCNGVLVQDATPLEGGGGHRRRSTPRAFPETGPLKLQDHGNTTQFRNIWIRPLPPRSIEGGTDGQLSPEATTAKRKEIAAEIRDHARELIAANNRQGGTMRLFESLIYENDPAILKEATGLAGEGIEHLEKMSPEQLENSKAGIMKVKNAFAYLAKHKIVPADFPPLKSVEAVIEKQGWNKKK